MGLEEIVEEIRAKGKAEADKITGETDQETSKIIADARSQAEKIIAAKKESVRKEINRLNQQELSSAHLEVKRTLLNARKEILDMVYEKAVEGIQNLDPERNRKILGSIIEKNEDKNSKIYSKRDDKAVVQNLTKLTFAGEIECLGGVVIENEDGSERLDFKYDTILRTVSEQSLKQISDILFG